MSFLYTLVSMKILPVCVAILLTLNAAAQRKEPVKLADNYTIITYSPTLPELKQVYANAKPKPNGLTKTETDEIDRLLRQSVEEYNQKQEEEFAKWKELDSTLKKEDFMINLSEYKRQYVPVITETNEAEVWVNAICYWAGERWRKEIIRVDDGGKCYFNVKINLSKKAYNNMTVNAQ